MAILHFGNEFIVSTVVPFTTTHFDYAGAATGLANGGFALTYVSYPTQTYQARVYDGFGAAIAGPAGIGTVNGGVSYRDGGIAELTSGRLVETFSESGPAIGDSIDVAITSVLPNLTGFAAVANPGPNGPTFQFGLQFRPALASSKLGGYMVVWDDDASSYGRPGINVIAQVFDNNGVALGPAFVASAAGANSSGNEIDPDVDRLASGGYVVAWQGADASGSGIRARMFDSKGANPSAEIAVNQLTANSQTGAAVAGLTGGGFVVAWMDSGRIEARVFNKNGGAVTGDIVISQFAAGNKTAPDVTALKDGGFLVTWTTDANAANGGDGAGTAIKARAFSKAGAATSGEVLVNSVSTGNQRDSIAATLADGRVIVTWTDESNALNSGREVRAQILDPRTKGVKVDGTSGIDKYVGSAFADVLRGLGGNDNLRAGAGKDKVDGGLGNDLLLGGPAKDSFLFTTALNALTNVDRLPDFAPGTDRILLDNKIFTKLKAEGTLKAKYFKKGDKAKDKNDYIVHNRDTGDLVYDKNGSKKGGAVKFAVVNPDLKVGADDFLVI